MHLGLQGLTAASFYEVADTGCDAAYRASVQLLTEFEVSQKGTTIDVSQQASSGAAIHAYQHFCQHNTGLVFVSLQASAAYRTFPLRFKPYVGLAVGSLAAL